MHPFYFQETLKAVNEFMGKRKFGKVLRRGSVAVLKKVEDMLDSATNSHGAKQAAVSSIPAFKHQQLVLERAHENR